jgi:hypothetical protein
VRNAKADDYRFSSIVIGIVDSIPFQMKMKQASASPAASPSATDHAIKESAATKQEGAGS